MREIAIDGERIDSGPTVFTMRWVFDELFEQIGERLEDHVSLHPLDVLARHAWTDGTRLDLFADEERSADAIGRFSGRAEAEGYRAFCADAKRIFDVLKAPFICAPAPSMTALLRSSGFRDLTAISRSRRCGRRSALISAIRACSSCSVATPPTAARRHSMRPPP